MNQFLQIAPDGVLFLEGEPLSNNELAYSILNSLFFNDSRQLKAFVEDQEYFVEAFDQPLIVNKVQLLEQGLQLTTLHYDFSFFCHLDSLCLDEWDRFLGHSLQHIPFVLEPQAQDQLFELCDHFDDDSITLKGQKIPTPSWLAPRSETQQESFWTQRYVEQNTPWDLNSPSPALIQTLPQLKLSKSRVANLGCGTGNDAAYFAEQGHLVHGFDISPKALEKAQTQFSHFSNLHFHQTDIFDLPSTENNSYDLIFEHTCYCAISPHLRNQLVQTWKQLLDDKGYLFGIFFSMDRRQGPPFGGSEWEVQKRLEPHFDILYWNRWRQSPSGRQGKEFVVFAQKKS